MIVDVEKPFGKVSGIQRIPVDPVAMEVEESRTMNRMEPTWGGHSKRRTIGRLAETLAIHILKKKKKETNYICKYHLHTKKKRRNYKVFIQKSHSVSQDLKTRTFAFSLQ